MLATSTEKKLSSEQRETLSTPQNFFDYLKKNYYVKDGENPENHFLGSIIIDAPCFHTSNTQLINRNQVRKPAFAILLEDPNEIPGAGELNLIFGVNYPHGGTAWSRLVAIESTLHRYRKGEITTQCCCELLSPNPRFGKDHDALAEMYYITAFFKLMEEYLSQLV